MGRIAFCLLIVLTATSFKIVDKTRPAAHGDLLAKIERARKLLEPEGVDLLKGTVGTKRVRVGRRKYQEVPVTGIVGREMALAIMDSAGDIRIARGIKRDKGLDVLTSGFLLNVRRDNGINSDIAVLQPEGGKVLAVKYPVSNEGNRFGPGESVIQAIYTPYSAEIKNNEVIERGIEIQTDLIKRAYARLSERAVFSRAYPGRKVVDVVPQDVLTVLLMNEHIDPGLFKSSGLAKPLVEQVLTIIATNREKAYAYSVSSAGARGLVQMIPSTYRLIASRYPSARLDPSFSAGMSDPVNAIIAQVLLCDSDWESIRSQSDIGPDRVGPYLAAAYNGGVGRVLSVLKHDKEEWMESPDLSRRPTKTVTVKVPVRSRTRRGKSRVKYVLKSYTQPIFMSETSKYVSQYHWINDFFVARGAGGFKSLKED
ncbi:MAG TPA: transglycosylase SLT domain-containing protein [Blastocatellia bacterium]|nr:transglycosylase SLT domain-containing protein [Blastocatellia bacterium]